MNTRHHVNKGIKTKKFYQRQGIELDEESFAVLPFHVVVPRFLYAQGFITVRTLSWSCSFEVLELDVRCFAMLPFQVAVPR